MQREVNKNIDWCNCLIMSAAVADYRAKKRLSYKLKKTKDELTLKLIRNPDILKAVSRNNKDKIIVGFSLETNNLIKNAKKKLRNKKLDLIISNKKTLKSNPFGPGNGDFILIDKSLNVKQLKDISKKYLSRLLLDTIEKLCYT
jgi:phosphopantothenoylcysteine decarboxylase/phosphopantothenate--cysteine ligase